MSTEDEEEYSISLNTTPDQKTVNITIESQKPIETLDLIMILETYLMDLIRASKAEPAEESELH